MKRIILIAAVCLIATSFSPFSPRTTAQQRNQLGGRPGEFHFILKDQADHNRAAFREMQFRIERMRADVLASSANEGTRARMISDLDNFQMFVASMETQLSTPVGQTAGDVELRLNVAKGQANCSTCHENSAVRAFK